MLPQTSSRLWRFRLKKITNASVTALVLGAMILPQGSLTSASAAEATSAPVSAEKIPTATPIKHIIYIVGENRSFDNAYATYQPKNGQKIWNLLSEGIVNADGTPGPNFAQGRQFQATTNSGTYFLSPVAKIPYSVLPVPTTDAGNSSGVGTGIVNPTTGAGIPPFPTPAEPELPAGAPQILLTTGGIGQNRFIDNRNPGFANLVDGPYPQTGPGIPYDSYEGDTEHSVFPMRQASDCSMMQATPANPTGCIHDLYPFVATTYATVPGTSSGDGSQDMAFYNMSQGDAPIFKALADQFTISDNFHQSMFGPSTPGAISTVFGDDVFYSDGNGNPTVPPVTPSLFFENPNPKLGTVNEYVQQGALVICSDPTQPGVAPVMQYLATLPYVASPNCQPGAAYLTANLTPAFTVIGTPAAPALTVLPPVTQRHIGDVLNDGNIPWMNYGGDYKAAVSVAQGASDIVTEVFASGYRTFTNAFQYSTSIMGNPAQIAAHLGDVVGGETVNGTMIRGLFQDIAAGTLPPVSFVKPDSAIDGHPGTSKLDLFEAFVQNVVTQVQANPKLWADTAIIVSYDESGGFYDSGFIQAIDFFGDGPRMPLLVISPYSTGGHVSHSYNDQASVLKFIERNWNLGKISTRSRDNLPNPVMSKTNLWVPTNMPALGDLFDMFDFSLQATIQNDVNNIEDEVNQEVQTIEKDVQSEINSVEGK
jgi:phospholipase C